MFDQHLSGVELFYSVKANNDPALLKYLSSRGVGFDVASVNEIAMVLGAGAKPRDLILSNTVKSPQCIREIFTKRVRATTVDNIDDLRALAKESTFHSFRPSVLVRIKLTPVGVDINLNEKFGCTPEAAVELLRAAHEMGLPAEGIHFHVGTQCRTAANYQIGIEHAITALLALEDATGLHVRTIDIGGGFPDELTANENGGLEHFFYELGAIVQRAQKMGFTIVAEPGRVVASGAGIAVTQVIGRNQHEGREWVYLDDGIYGLFSTAYYEKRRFQFVPLDEHPDEWQPFVVAGPTCDSLDVVGWDIILPSSIQTGDYLLSYHDGAYSISVKSNFNGIGQISTAVSQHAVVDPSYAMSRQAVGS